MPEREFYLLVIAGCIIAFLIVLACCCCCSNVAQSGRNFHLKAELVKARKAATTPKELHRYVQVPPADDKKRLIVHDN